MKRITALITAAVMMVSLSACGNKTEEVQLTPEQLYGMSGVLVDNGVFNAFCPEGWTDEPQYTLEQQTEASLMTDVLQFVKEDSEEEASESDTDAPFIVIQYVPVKEDLIAPDSSYYNEVERVAAFTTGGYNWSGYYAYVEGHKFAYLTTSTDEAQYAVTVWLQNDGSGVTLEDDDVKAILSSIALTEEE